MTETATNLANNSEALEVLWEKGTLVHLFIGRWAAVRKMSADDLRADLNKDAIYPGHKKLMPPEAMQKLVNLEGKARTTLAKKSLDFPIGGARFVYKPTWPEVRKELEFLKKEWDQALDELVEKYEELKEKQLLVLDEQAQSIAKEDLRKVPEFLKEEREKKLVECAEWLDKQRADNRQLYPSKAELKSRFSFRWRIFEVVPPQGMSAADIAQAKQTLKEDLNFWVKDAAKAMHQALGEAAYKAKSLLEKQGKLNPKNLKPLFDAFETFKAIDFTGQSEFLKVIDAIREEYGVTKTDGTVDFEATAGSINFDNQAKTQLNDLLGKVAKLAVESVAEQAGKEAITKVGEFQRFVDLG